MNTNKNLPVIINNNEQIKTKKNGLQNSFQARLFIALQLNKIIASFLPREK